MQTTHRHLSELISPKGLVSATAKPALQEMVEQYPYFHLARLTLLRLLYQQRDPEFNDELRRSALYLPSRETIFNFVEADKMVPRAEEEAGNAFGGAIVSRKPNQRLGRATEGEGDNRTESLIDSFLNSIPKPEPVVERPAAPVRRGRVDATVDYISYMLEEEMAQGASAPVAETSPVDVTPEAEGGVESAATSVAATDEVQQPEVKETLAAPAESKEKKTETGRKKSGTTELIDKFIQKQGDKRIKLKDKSDSDLQKPVIDADNSQQKGAFTETLARIYIKQGKFEHAIEIIRRLSLKYPKKNRYFADQIRFLEKIIANNKAKKD